MHSPAIKRFTRAAMIVCWLSASQVLSPFAWAQTARVVGHVRDETGAAVVGARVKIQNAGRESATITAADGSFTFTDAVSGTLTVKAAGFAEFSRLIPTSNSASTIEVVLSPATLREQVTVTATRTETPLGSTAASVRLFSAKELSSSGALAIDDVLRQVPGFQLFRRTGSRTANPTSQGVSLRGVGTSGASRALVLANGIPFADPFGAWIYWDRIPRAAVKQVEVVRGGSSDLYGSSAMGGVINILTRTSDEPTISFESSYGNQSAPFASVFAGTRANRFYLDLAGEVFQTDGFINIREDNRGAVDIPVDSRHRSLYVEFGFHPNNRSRLFVRPSYFAEQRSNGTLLQTNRTHVAEIDGGADFNPNRAGEFSLRGYLSTQTYDQNFSAIAADRNSESLTRLQRVPAQAGGLILQWTQRIAERQSLLGGFEAREVRGASDEIVYDRGKASSFVGAGGRQSSYAFFFRDTIQLNSRLTLAGGARLDRFRNIRGVSVSRAIVPGALEQVTRFADVSELAFSPQFSILYHANDKLSFFGAFNTAFRAPTLNELYRSFRIGNVLTLANERLKRERVAGGESGARLSLWDDRFDLRASFFFSSVNHPIANVTLASSPALITRQRQNLGSTRSLGLEIDSAFRLPQGWNITAGYLFSDARVVSFSANPLLEGLVIPQTPRHTFTFQLSYAGRLPYKFGLQGRASGSQFEDDQNLLPLGSVFTIDAYVSRQLGRHLEVFAAAENLFNSRYEVGRTPIVTVGPPLLVRTGIKINFRKDKHGN